MNRCRIKLNGMLVEIYPRGKLYSAFLRFAKFANIFGLLIKPLIQNHVNMYLMTRHVFMSTILNIFVEITRRRTITD
jgi:hypothetical protein